MCVLEQVCIDNREHERVEKAKYYYSVYNPIVKQLEYGDYLFKGKNKVEVLFEYKTAQDFFNSVLNNHLHNQTMRASMRSDYQFVIIECPTNLEQEARIYEQVSGQNMSIFQINGAISSLNCFSTVLLGQSIGDCFDLMQRQAIKIIQNKPLKWKFGRKKPNTALNYLNCILGLDSKAELIVDEYDLTTLEDLLNLNIEDLTKIKGIGNKTAKKIIKTIK